MTSGQQATVKWLALAAMLLDHIGAVLLPDAWGLRVVGRLAFPAFVALIAYNLTVRAVPVRRYSGPLAAALVVSQLPYALVLSAERVNIFGTLLLGVVAWGVVRRDLAPAWGLTLAAAPLVEYGAAGVLMLPLVGAFLTGSRLAGVVAVVTLAVAQGSPFYGPVAVAVALVGVLLVRALPALPRGPRWLAYAFYPVHLLVLGALRLVAVSA